MRNGYVAAGLPNITGSVKSASRNGDYLSGAFYSSNNSAHKGISGRIDGGGDSNYTACTATLNASRSSAIYGAGNTVIPNSVKIRVKTRYK